MKTLYSNSKVYGRYMPLTFILLMPIGIVLTLFSGCKKFVEVPSPPTQLLSTAVFSNGGTATSAMLNIYSQMYANIESYNLELNTGVLGDELIDYGSYPDVYQDNLVASGNYYGPWQNAYNYIYQANAVIAGLNNNSAITPSVSKQLTGEAYFIRAFWHLYLMNCYGDVPIVITTNYKVTEKLARSPKQDVLNQVITDLTTAQGMLSKNFVDVSDIAVTTDRVRPTYWAATALLARAYLFAGKYAQAQAAATTVIQNSASFSLQSDLTQVFLANSQEAIWQLPIPLPNYYNTAEGAYFILIGAPGSGSVSLSTQLMAAFEPGDKREAEWTNSYTGYYYAYKYRVPNSVTAISEYTMVLRLAEQYLIRAEAEAQQNDISDAANDLNAIRSRAGLLATTATDQPTMLAAVLHERQVELFTEWGDRWFTMNRMGVINSIMGSPGNVCQFKGGTWNPDGHQALMPISTSEIINDPNLKQTPGY